VSQFEKAGLVAKLKHGRNAKRAATGHCEDRVFCAVACWDDKDKRIALAQITRLARLHEVNFYTEPALAPQSGNSKRRPRPGTGRLGREPS
jgi:hypothetical protein